MANDSMVDEDVRFVLGMKPLFSSRKRRRR